MLYVYRTRIDPYSVVCSYREILVETPTIT
nr:MAG TPA: hypothetical protein [Caudoviricetes sp.]